MHWSTRVVAAAIALGAVAGLSCAGPDESPIWSLGKTQYDPYGNVALLSPANDSRVNLLLLLAARDGKPGPADIGARTFFSWGDLTQAIEPADPEQDYADPSRCQSLAGGDRDFLAALSASRASRADKIALADARKLVAAACGESGSAPPSAGPGPVKSSVGRAFQTYLEGAAAFYRGDFADADRAFSALDRAPDAWLRETASYMTARTALNAATAAAFDEYGYPAAPEERDPAPAARATAAFESYLRSHLQGRYAGSARGLLRRAHWVAGDQAALAGDYAALLAASPAPRPMDALRLAEEIDYKLPSATDAEAGPLLLAISDLQRMRSDGEYSEACCPPLGEAELASQAPAFRDQPELYGYLRAAHAIFVANEPRRASQIIPDESGRQSHDALSFSRQMLRGLALDAAGDTGARSFWLALIEGATAPGQRRTVELALARHDEVAGQLDRVFATDSRVSDPIARAILLQHGAAPALLRRQAEAGGTAHERATALYILLAKQLTRGFYADFLRDLALVPGDAEATGGIVNAASFANPDELLAIEVSAGDFTAGPLGEFGCPALRETVAALERNPLQPRARLCLGEFLRLNGFDWASYDEPLGQGLGSSRSQFPGTVLRRQTIYQGVIADPKAGANDKAFALFRAVHCYAPAGNNDCGGTDVPVSQRRAWFRQLKRDYPQSQWARELKYFW